MGVRRGIDRKKVGCRSLINANLEGQVGVNKFKLYQHTKFELNRCSLSKVFERTPNFGRTHGLTDGRTDRGNTLCPSTILRMAGA